ncbi:hypothetical protein E2542_SST19252 [Spatholobus suberectus]|nr:hypothetical protein E2542_SST19252 [Spatholobus suberectus]
MREKRCKSVLGSFSKLWVAPRPDEGLRVLGQKLSIDVTAGSSSLAPAEAPSPPKSGAAMPVAVTVYDLLTAVAINVLF